MMRLWKLILAAARAPGTFMVADGRAEVPVEPTLASPRAIVGIQLDRDASGPGGRVYGVRVGSPADKAGLTHGDRIVSVDGESVADWPALQRIIGQGGPGVVRRLTVQRNGIAFDVSLVPEDPLHRSEQPESLFGPTYRAPCEVGSLWLLLYGGIVVVALALWGALNGASPSALLWGGAAWLIAWSVAGVEGITLCGL